MGVAKYAINGSSFVGAFVSITEDYAFTGRNLTKGSKAVLDEVLGVKRIEFSIMGFDMIGVFARANRNGIIFSNMIEDGELEAFKGFGLGVNVSVLESDLNAIGNNILANDKIAFVNPEYSKKEINNITEILGVEAIPMSIGGFKTVGANNLLTNKGMVINNRCTEEEKEKIDSITGFESSTTNISVMLF
ncbi:MAG: hypothetical protein M1364_00430, partial [Candidatus Marsarchaeota archaeon]|nr:hypothetical protein [Candidatus Marsarchaeota archaeon]